MKPVIAIDVDGCLLFWQTHAVQYCIENGLDTKLAELLQSRDIFINPFQVDGVESVEHIVKYNESDFMSNLKYYGDAVEFIEKHKNQYDFIAITAMSPKSECLLRRKDNLKDIFGRGVFKEILGCNIRESKVELFKKVHDKYGLDVVAYIDDMAHHIDSASRHLHRGVKLFHLIRDVRDSSTVPCAVVSKLTQIDLGI